MRTHLSLPFSFMNAGFPLTFPDRPFPIAGAEAPGEPGDDPEDDDADEDDDEFDDDDDADETDEEEADEPATAGAAEHEGAVEEEVGDRTGPGAGYDVENTPPKGPRRGE